MRLCCWGTTHGPPTYATEARVLERLLAIAHDVSDALSQTGHIIIPLGQSVVTHTVNPMKSVTRRRTHTAPSTQSCGIMSPAECT